MGDNGNRDGTGVKDGGKEGGGGDAEFISNYWEPSHDYLLGSIQFFTFHFLDNAEALLTCATHAKAFSKRERSPSVGWKQVTSQASSFSFLYFCKTFARASAKF